MLTKVAGSKPREQEVRRKGQILSVEIEGDHIVVELDWVALYRGNAYFEDDSSTTIDMRVDELYSGCGFSLIIRSRYKDLIMTYSFLEKSHEDILLREKVRSKKE